jgi:hypothetical protein
VEINIGINITDLYSSFISVWKSTLTLTLHTFLYSSFVSVWKSTLTLTLYTFLYSSFISVWKSTSTSTLKTFIAELHFCVETTNNIFSSCFCFAEDEKKWWCKKQFIEVKRMLVRLVESSEAQVFLLFL